MDQFRRFRWLSLTAMLILALSGCSHQSSASNPSPQSNESEIPFHPDSQASSQANDPQNPDAASTMPDQSQNQSGSGLPFRTLAGDLPAGTLLTVRLDNALSTAKLDASGVFAAVIDEPIIVDGKTLIARGTSVLGRIESARASEIKRNTGYVRLTLSSIKIQGREFHLQTSSLFARGFVRNTQEPGNHVTPSITNQPAAGPQPTIIDLQKGRRLTFRLTENLSLAG